MVLEWILVLFHSLPDVGGCALLTTAADIYSFGILMYEVATGQAVYPNMLCGDVVRGVLHGGLRPQFSNDYPPEYTCLARRCVGLCAVGLIALDRCGFVSSMLAPMMLSGVVKPARSFAFPHLPM